MSVGGFWKSTKSVCRRDFHGNMSRGSQVFTVTPHLPFPPPPAPAKKGITSTFTFVVIIVQFVVWSKQELVLLLLRGQLSVVSV
jgi:hypothetical protein